GPGEAGAYDMGRLLAEGVARAPELTRAGVRAGLERVKALPAASGRAGTLMGFGNWDRGALKGPYLVLREWRGGVSGGAWGRGWQRGGGAGGQERLSGRGGGAAGGAGRRARRPGGW